ncbi:hypothetical protein GCM10010377_72980 [Streptomyces viridiviolaceus]|nr:hypothetical protein GCM10010377_72980 [Streptomyces viridiviolaceus]
MGLFGLPHPLLDMKANLVWADIARVLSLLFDAGWSWGALAVAVGWLAQTWVRGALVGVLALAGATVSYYVTDAFAWGLARTWSGGWRWVCRSGCCWVQWAPRSGGREQSGCLPP